MKLRQEMELIPEKWSNLKRETPGKELPIRLGHDLARDQHSEDVPSI
jgi:hypothetical protein